MFKRRFERYIAISIFIPLIVAFVVSSCNFGNLSQSRAKKLLEKELNIIETTKIPTGYVETSIFEDLEKIIDEALGSGIKAATLETYKELADKGLINLSILSEDVFLEVLYVEITDEIAGKYVRSTEKGEEVEFNNKIYTRDESEVILADVKIKNIASITELSIVAGQKTCIVDFAIQIERTPFGDVMLPDLLQKDFLEMRALFVRDKDGWQVGDKMMARELWK